MKPFNPASFFTTTKPFPHSNNPPHKHPRKIPFPYNALYPNPFIPYPQSFNPFILPSHIYPSPHLPHSNSASVFSMIPIACINSTLLITNGGAKRMAC